MPEQPPDWTRELLPRSKADEATLRGIATERALVEWLVQLGWNDPLQAAERVGSLLARLIEQVEREGEPARASLYYRTLSWLDSQQDPETGLWGGSGTDSRNARAAAARIADFYAYVRQPMLATAKMGWVGAAREPHVPHRLWMREPAGGAGRFSRDADTAVVVTCFNLGDYLFEALDSVARQTLKPVQLVIVDDGSTEPYTAAYLDFLADRGYHVIRQANAGLATARNNGIRAANAEFICCFDADDRMHPAWVERAKCVLESDLGLGYVSCYYRCFDNDHSEYRYDGVRFPEMLVTNQTAVVSMFRREAWERVGGYCPEFSIGMEDWDFWISILEAGYRASVIPAVLFHYRKRVESMLAVTQQPENYEKNTKLLLTRHAASFEAHWPEVVHLYARQLGELLAVRSAETHTATRTIHALEREAEELRDPIHQVWRAALAAAVRHQDAAVRVAGLVRLAFLIFSPSGFARAVKNLLLWLKAYADKAARQRWNDLFDCEYYLRTNIDVLLSGIPASLHYLIRGGTEGRQASESFDTKYYLRRHPDVARAGINPLLHFVLFGSEEHRITGQGHDGAGCAPVPFPPEDLQPVYQPLVSVVIPCFNYGSYLPDAIAAVEAQTLRNIEIIVVEGGSTDGTTPEMVRAIEAGGSTTARFLYRGEPHFAGDNRNFGIEHARAPYICCLDADDIVKPAYLECAAFMAETYGYDLVGTSVQAFGEDKFTWIVGPPSLEQMKQHNQIATAALFRKAAWEDAGRFRDWGRGEHYVAEDWELWLRMLAKGYQAANIAEPLLNYRVHGRSLWQTATTSLEHQRQAILATNRELLEHAGEAHPQSSPLPFSHPWENLLADAEAQRTVLLAMPFVIIGGAEAQFAALVRGMTARGIRVVMITTELLPPGVTDDTARFERLTPYVYPLAKLFENDSGRWRDFLLFLIARYKPETLLNVGNNFVYTLLPVLKSAVPKLKVLDQLFNEGPHFVSNRKYAPFIDGTITLSELLSAKLVEAGADPAAITSIPNCIEVPDELPSADFDAEFFPAAFAGKSIVSFFGRLSEEKAPLDFVEIAHALRHREDIRFFIAGEGPEQPAVRKRIAQLGLKERVFAPGAVRNVDKRMRQSAMVVLTSHLDGMPTVLLEAQAQERPVVASAVGSVPAMISDGKTGFLCQPRDIQAFASRIVELVDSPELRDRMGRAGRAFVREHFTAEQMVGQYLRVLDRLAGLHVR